MKRNLPIAIDEGDYVEDRDFARLEIGEDGQIIIPKEMLKALGFEIGQQIVARNENGQLLIETRDQVEQRLHARFAHLPKDVSWANELIKERREAAKREAEEASS